MELDPIDDRKVWVTTSITMVKGDQEIPAGQEATYKLKGFWPCQSVLFIQWLTVTGKKEKAAWIVNWGALNVAVEDAILPLTFGGYLKFIVKLLWANFLTPWLFLIKWWRFRVKGRQDNGTSQ